MGAIPGGFAAYKEYLARKFQHQGTGDWNYFKLFLENNLTLLKRAAGSLFSSLPASRRTKAAPHCASC